MKIGMTIKFIFNKVGIGDVPPHDLYMYDGTTNKFFEMNSSGFFNSVHYDLFSEKGKIFGIGRTHPGGLETINVIDLLKDSVRSILVLAPYETFYPCDYYLSCQYPPEIRFSFNEYGSIGVYYAVYDNSNHGVNYDETKRPFLRFDETLINF